ncbi:NAD-dependent epimerase/dehydratase family protein [bacterium]|nr:NAD-dependent epimerase/dehydratase family protein [bacterium]
MRALVLGASGFLGSHVTRALLAAGHDVQGFRREASQLDNLRGIELPWWTGDLRDPDSLRRAIAGRDTVFCAAGLLSLRPRDKERLHETNVIGARNVAQACLEAHARLVWTGSAAVYAGSPRLEPADELGVSSGERFSLDYATSIALAEAEVLRAVARGLDAVLLHPGLLVGPGDLRFHSSWLLAGGFRLLLCPPGGMNVVPVEDVARALLVAHARARTGSIYLLGGENLTNRALLELVRDVTGSSAPIVAIPRGGYRKLGEIASVLGAVRLIDHRDGFEFDAAVGRAATLYWFVSSKKAEAELGWKPGPIRPALEAQLAWLRRRGLAPAPA